MSMHTVAVMGLGVRGKIHLHGLLENPDYYKVVGLCDIDEPKMKAVAEEYPNGRARPIAAALHIPLLPSAFRK